MTVSRLAALSARPTARTIDGHLKFKRSVATANLNPRNAVTVISESETGSCVRVRLPVQCQWVTVTVEVC